MQTLKHIDGRWRGTYEYDPSEALPNLPSVDFTLNLKHGWFGHFKGSVTDDPANGIPGTGSIDGYLSFPRIRFTKRMPVAYVIQPNGPHITLRETIVAMGFPSWEQDYPAPPILYEGTFSDPARAQGTWVINPIFVRLPGGRALRTKGSTGTWKIELQAV